MDYYEGGKGGSDDVFLVEQKAYEYSVLLRSELKKLFSNRSHKIDVIVTSMINSESDVVFTRILFDKEGEINTKVDDDEWYFCYQWIQKRSKGNSLPVSEGRIVISGNLVVLVKDRSFSSELAIIDAQNIVSLLPTPPILSE